tara:strand:+ start:18 stop:596 length:579 start_codon:yes stop_codon:yes gene_type:complete
MKKKDTGTYTYDQVAGVLMVIGIASLWLASTWNMDNQINDLKLEMQQQADSLHSIIDSMQCEIDTLVWKTEIWDHNISNNTTHLLSALIMVESSNNDSAYNAREDAVGCLQIRKTMVDDVNRILKRQGKTFRYSYEDRWLRNRSIKMFDIYCKHYGLTTAEEIARCWNGGPRGMQNEMTAGYWKKVKKNLDS